MENTSIFVAGFFALTSIFLCHWVDCLKNQLKNNKKKKE